MAKRIGHKWKEITIEEKEKFQLMASKEKEIYKEQLEAYKKQMGDDYVENTNQSSSALSSDHPNSLIFPIARISKIAKLDPDINAISKEGINLIVKSTELFLSKLGTDSMKVASQSNRRTIYSNDIKQICSSGQKQEFLFLKDDIKDITRELLLQKETQKLLKIANALKAGNEEGGEGGEGEDDGDNGAVTAVLTGKAAAAAAGSKPLTSYFTSK
jgi:histone H3/H4